MVIFPLGDIKTSLLGFGRYSKQEREETKANIFFLFIEKFREIKGRKSVEVGKMLPVSRDESR